MAKFGSNGSAVETPSVNANAQRLSLLDRILPPQARSNIDPSLIQNLMAASIRSSQGSGSPLLAALAPIVGGVATARAQAAEQAQAEQSIDSFIGSFVGESGLAGGDSDRLRELLLTMSNENTPDAVRSLASRMVTQMLPTRRRSSGGGRRRSPSGGSSSGRPRLFGTYSLDGILHGRTPTGQMVPYLGPDGQPVRDPQAGASGSATPPAPAATPPAQSAQVAGPLTLPSLEQQASDRPDPLGLFRIPPA